MDLNAKNQMVLVWWRKIAKKIPLILDTAISWKSYFNINGIKGVRTEKGLFYKTEIEKLPIFEDIKGLNMKF